MPGLNFPAATSAYVSLGDVAAARFEDLKAWTVLCFFRIESITDERTLIAKWTTSKLQFRMRLDQGIHLEVGHGGVSTIQAGGNNVSLDTWYIAAITNDGLSGDSSGHVILIGLDGTVHDNVSFAMNADAGDLTADLRIGVREEGPSDPMDGDESWCTYIQNQEFSTDAIKEFLANPLRAAKRYGSDCVFCLPMGMAGSGSTEPDWSGNGNNGTINGSPTVGQGPPTRAPSVLNYPRWVDEVAAAPAGDIPIFMHHYKQLMGVN